MKLRAEIGGEEKLLELDRSGDDVRARIDGREYDLKVSEPEPGLFVLRDGARRSVAFVSRSADGSSLVTVDGRTLDVRLTDPKRLRGATSGQEHGDGLAEIKTAMPGKVVRILVTVGDAVAKGDGVIVVEAMKMQNEMRSPKDGTVRTIRPAEGDTVNAGDVLVVIE